MTCVIRNVPAGLGEPVFDKLEAMLAHAMLSIPATKAFELGSGFRGTQVPGSRHNDAFALRADGRMGTRTNWSGGVQGGISNGEDIYFRVGFKSPATISQAQETAQYDGTPGTLAARGRHDPCVVPRAVPIVEAMAALVIMDLVLMQNARKTASSLLPPITTLPPTMVKPAKPVQNEVVKPAKPVQNEELNPKRGQDLNQEHRPPLDPPPNRSLFATLFRGLRKLVLCQTVPDN